MKVEQRVFHEVLPHSEGMTKARIDVTYSRGGKLFAATYITVFGQAYEKNGRSFTTEEAARQLLAEELRRLGK